MGRSPYNGEHRTYILVTGTNSGLGFAICRRLIDEFVQTRPFSQSLTLIPTTRSVKKSEETVARLQGHLRKLDDKWDGKCSTRVIIRPESVDLTSLSSVRALATKLLDSIPHLDTIICNAGFGGTTGINWPLCLWTMATDFVNALTYPQYKISDVGLTTALQGPFAPSPSADNERIVKDPGTTSSSKGNPTSEDQPPLGQVFASNVFGHYLLGHFLLPLLSASPDAGRIIWMSTLEALPQTFNRADIQGLTTNKAYESSKRLTDILALTSTLPGTAPFVKRFLTPPTVKPPTGSIDGGGGASDAGRLQSQDKGLPTPEEEEEEKGKGKKEKEEETSRTSHTDHQRDPAIYLTHPGICSTNFVALPFIMQLCMTASFFLARWLGSPWHTATAWAGAKAPVWVALASREEMEDEEGARGRGKWGSCVDRMGREGVRRTAVAGWGVGGQVGERKEKGHDEEMVVATREEKEEFEELGRECWREMEALRVAWEARLKGEE